MAGASELRRTLTVTFDLRRFSSATALLYHASDSYFRRYAASISAASGSVSG